MSNNPPIFPPFKISNNFFVAVLSKQVNCVIGPFQDLFHPPSSIFFFFPNHSPWLVTDATLMILFHILCRNRQPFFFKTQLFFPCVNPNTSTRVTRGIPPYLLLASQITDANSLCLDVWADRLPCRVLAWTTEWLGVFQAVVSSLKSRHTRLPFSKSHNKQKLCCRTSAASVCFPVLFGTKDLKPCVFGNSKKPLNLSLRRLNSRDLC